MLAYFLPPGQFKYAPNREFFILLNASAKEAGQIYMPEVNWLLLVAVLLAVLGFDSSSALASAYGIAVTVTMLVNTGLTFFVVRHAWRYPLPVALAARIGNSTA